MPTFTFQSENEKHGAADTNIPPPAAPGTARYKKRLRWAEHTPASDKPALNARSTAAEVPLLHLKISPEQRVLIEAMYHCCPVADDTSDAPRIEDHIFGLDSGAQLQASAIMARHGLDANSRERRVGANRWSQQWSRRSDTPTSGTRKILYLCACGYDHRQRNTKYDRGEDTNGTQERRAGAPFTGCLAHAEITLRTDKILRIRGHFDHNDACKAALSISIA
ncbi:hypothetical protein B0H15DRAFT_856996 [Mycena belliarum]|uniref:Uncharacterized protein n=1 Tax=Mycena belliarum TaxID=1033014 RepID=A0AAD6TWU3_9AGAR|nr:hypothetical protein B0H15DRAFT_856996 [Mycena belliae]